MNSISNIEGIKILNEYMYNIILYILDVFFNFYFSW